MRTDEHLLTVFKERPEWLFELAGEPVPGECRMASESQKTVVNLQLSTDSVIRPVETEREIFVVEFLLTPFKDDPYINLVLKMALLHRDEIPLTEPQKEGGRRRRGGSPRRGVRGFLIISKALSDPKTEPWRQVVTTLMFEEIAQRFAEANPAHPLTHWLQPLIVDDKNTLEQLAGSHYRALKQLQTAGEISSQICDSFVDLIWQRFRDQPVELIRKMIFTEDIDMKDTPIGRELWTRALDEGRTEGQAGVLVLLFSKRFGNLPEAVGEGIRSLPGPALDRLALAMLDLGSLGELESWLAQNANS